MTLSWSALNVLVFLLWWWHATNPWPVCDPRTSSFFLINSWWDHEFSLWQGIGCLLDFTPLVSQVLNLLYDFTLLFWWHCNTVSSAYFISTVLLVLGCRWKCKMKSTPRLTFEKLPPREDSSSTLKAIQRWDLELPGVASWVTCEKFTNGKLSPMACQGD